MEEPKPKGFQSNVLEAGLQLDFSLCLGRSEWLSGVYLKGSGKMSRSVNKMLHLLPLGILHSGS